MIMPPGVQCGSALCVCVREVRTEVDLQCNGWCEVKIAQSVSLGLLTIVV